MCESVPPLSRLSTSRPPRSRPTTATSNSTLNNSNESTLTLPVLLNELGAQSSSLEGIELGESILCIGVEESVNRVFGGSQDGNIHVGSMTRLFVLC